jgi:hypothetical protein
VRKRLRTFYGATLPRTYRGAWPYIVASAALLFVPALVAFFFVLANPDAAYVSGTGVSTREEIAKGIETDTCKVDGYVLRNEQVHSLSSDVALLTYRAMSDVTCGDRAIHADAWSSTLYVRDGDSWKVSFHQETDAQHASALTPG